MCSERGIAYKLKSCACSRIAPSVKVNTLRGVGIHLKILAWLLVVEIFSQLFHFYLTVTAEDMIRNEPIYPLNRVNLEAGVIEFWTVLLQIAEGSHFEIVLHLKMGKSGLGLC